MSVVRATLNLSLLAVVATTKVLAETTSAIALHLLDDASRQSDPAGRPATA